MAARRRPAVRRVGAVLRDGAAYCRGSAFGGRLNHSATPPGFQCSECPSQSNIRRGGRLRTASVANMKGPESSVFDGVSPPWQPTIHGADRFVESRRTVMGIMENLSNLASQFASGAASERDVHDAYDQTAATVPQGSLATALSHTFQSDQTPPFQQ